MHRLYLTKFMYVRTYNTIICYYERRQNNVRIEVAPETWHAYQAYGHTNIVLKHVNGSYMYYNI